jgi:hypothetical protein
MWHALPALENTAKMAVPPRNQKHLNTYKAGVQSEKTGFPFSGLLPKFKMNVLRLPRDFSNRSQ